MVGNSIMIDLEDPRTDKIADVISNKSAKKIIGLLAERELSESELSKELGMPMNTVGYNVRKLEEAGLIDKVKGFLWSVKGKRIHKYKISNKRIVISPKYIIRGVIPALLISVILALALGLFLNAQQPYPTQKIATGESGAAEIASDIGVESSRIIPPQPPVQEPMNPALLCANAWAWFLLGALVVILIFLIWNTYTYQMKGGKKK